ncbi:MAG: glycine--tRNA ligase subunit beta [Endomicrobium sp.]|jgi:glycyl-tRNA synthetase beta chain|nr:glycine--tRNA ligase subunit beta [Endomicrobium sp.]
MKDALLEIYTEEIPPLCIELALKQMENIASKIFFDSNLQYRVIEKYGTSRRLVLIIKKLCEISKGFTKCVLGPPLRISLDSKKKYTHIAIEFVKKNKITFKELGIKKTRSGEFLFFIKKIKGIKTEKLLATIFPDIIKNINFPKTMIWESSRFEFVRPIRNILAIYGHKKVKFRIADVNSLNQTIISCNYKNKKIRIDSVEKYISVMRDKYVIINQNERKEKLKISIQTVANRIGLAVFDNFLINYVNYLVEYPSAILCTFNKRYLTLPFEILEICIKKKQKCFFVNDKCNRLSNYFIAIKNGISEHQDKNIKIGYEKVVAARLADAELFYQNDLRNGINVNAQKLKKMVFQKEIGTIYDKIERIKCIANLFNEKLNMHIDKLLLEKIIMFSKIDLASEIVFEYPELQGIIGKIYALKLGESLEFAEAIEQHYWPLTASGSLPISKLASLISLSDKLDTLVSSLSLELEFSSSNDPHGIKRLGIGVARIIMRDFKDQDLTNIIFKIVEFLPKNFIKKIDTKIVKEKLINFLWQRIENILKLEGYTFSEIKTVINNNRFDQLKSPGLLYLKLFALRKAMAKPNFNSILSAFKRINNILNNKNKVKNEMSLHVVNELLLIEEAEKILFFTVKGLEIKIMNYISKNEYEKIFDEMSKISILVNIFFEKVLVMVKDKSIKYNRLFLLNYIKNIFSKFVDLSFL